MIDDDFVVETLVQDTFLKLWLHRDSIETPNHILGFLRFVLKRDCITYFNTPKNKFARLTASLESFANYQDYLIGDDPMQDREHLLCQESDQKNFDEINKVLKVINPKRKHLIELCLQYGFQYKPIAEAMGSSIKDISNEVAGAINDLRKILKENPNDKLPVKSQRNNVQQDELSSQQIDIMKRRFEQKSSFAVIARELKISEKQVHQEFLFAYQYLQNRNNSEITT